MPGDLVSESVIKDSQRQMLEEIKKYLQKIILTVELLLVLNLIK